MWASDADEDLAQLPTLSCQTICETLRARYSRYLVYTWCSNNTLVAVNPGSSIPGLYTEDVLRRCLKSAQGQAIQAKLEPHIYSSAALAYHNLLLWGSGSGGCGPSERHQTLIVSGISGAGKTESSKHLLRFLSYASQSRCETTAVDSSPAGHRIEEIVEASNPMLECFGNASTQENENSSRFGRHLELTFDRNGRLLGGRLQVLLLERSRLLCPWPTCNANATADRPFHAVLALADADCRSSLDDRLSCHLPPPPPLSHLPSASSDHSWSRLAPLLQRFLPSDLGPGDVARLLAGLLVLARLPIGSRGPEEDSLSEIPPAALAAAEAAACLGLGLPDVGRLLSALTQSRIESGRKSVFHRPCTPSECAGRRDALCRLVYDRLFAYLVGRINACISAVANPSATATIGILDLYGFENFPKNNGLDQLLINYANERLQHYYLTHFVLAAGHEYATERLPWGDFADPVGDESCGLAPSTSLCTEPSVSIVSDAITQVDRLLTALEEQCRLNRPDRQLAERLGSDDFAVRHFAGLVRYPATDLPARNRDRCPPELISVLLESRSVLLQRILQPQQQGGHGYSGLSDLKEESNSGRQRQLRRDGLAAKFRSDLGSLLDRLRPTRPLWIRCLRPLLSTTTRCPSDAAVGWSDEAVASQLESCGLLAATRAARHLHPVRISYADFLSRYGCLLFRTTASFSAAPAELDPAYRRQFDLPLSPRTPERRLRRRTGASPVDHQRRLAANILQGEPGVPPVLPGQQFGRSKLFLTALQVAALDSRLAEHRHGCVLRLQRAVRLWLTRRRQQQQRRRQPLAPLADLHNRVEQTVSIPQASDCHSPTSATFITPPTAMATASTTPFSALSTNTVYLTDRASIMQTPKARASCPNVSLDSTSPTAPPSLMDLHTQTGFASRHRLFVPGVSRRLSPGSRRQLFRGPVRADCLLSHARLRGVCAVRGIEDALDSGEENID